MVEATNEAKVSLILDINNALKSVETLQKRLDSISVKNIQVKEATNNIDAVGTSAVKTTTQVETLTKTINRYKKELESYYAQNYSKIDINNDATYQSMKQRLDNVIKIRNEFNKSLNNNATNKIQSSLANVSEQDELRKKQQLAEQALKNEMQVVNTALNYKKEQITAYKKYQSDAEITRNRIYTPNPMSKEIEATKELLKYQQEGMELQQKKMELQKQKSANYIFNQEVKATESLLEYQRDVKNNYKQFNNIANEVRNKTNPMAKDLEATDALLKYQEEVKNNYKHFADMAKLVHIDIPKQEAQIIKNNQSDGTDFVKKQKEFKSYSSELAKLERQGAVINRAIHQTLNPAEKSKLELELKKISKEYEKLNRESVQFRKEFGVSHTRGIYDLNHNLDYFRSKIRSRLVYGLATEIDNILMTAPMNFVNTMATYQQNRVNFAQVLPDNIANNQELMNKVMKDFTQIASDYGTAVNEVVEAGRLWGRQYKDIAVVQELVRNSTKLSITDNMSLTEVNKGLEATLQQYNIHLKDANEAQQVSGKVVDTWAKLADNAVVTAQDLAKANERSAGAAYQAGVGFDYLQAMITTMSAATGKAGGEIGRSIRSMLISMRTAKAEKEFAKLGIATTELVNGEKRIRSFEKVITELMQKLKTSPKDVYSLINAMSGGKYQFNNVMALLKNYDQFLKNLEVARNSQGWADEQVALQYQTISRQINALNADLQQLIRILDEAGASNGISSLIQGLREMVQFLQKIDPETYKLIGQTVGVFAGFKVLKTIVPYVISFKTIFAEAVKILVSSIPIIKAVHSGTLKLGIAFRLLSTMTGVLGFATAIGTALYHIAGAYSNLNVESMKQVNNELAKTTNSLITDASDYSSHEENINKYIQQIKNSKEVLDSTITTQEQKVKANEDLAEAERILTNILGESAKKRLEASGYTKEAINQEIESYIKLQIVSDDALQSRIQNEILLTEQVLEDSQLRIDQYQREIDALYSISQENYNKAKKEYDDYVKYYQGREDNIAHQAKLKDLQNALEEAKENVSNLYGKIVQKNSFQKEYDKARENLNRLQALANGIIFKDYKQPIINGIDGGVLEEETENIGKNFAEQAIRNQLSRERNQLWVEGKIEAQAYENALKTITNLEQAYGATEYSIKQKGSLFVARQKDLEDYQQKLEAFRNDLISIVDQEMQGNQKVAQMVGYKSDMTLKDKLQHFEVNKELYQQQKTYSSIINLISTVNAKIEETKGKTLEITNALEQQEEVLHNQRISDINRRYELEDAIINRPTNYNYENQKIKLQIAQQLELIKEKNDRIRQLDQELAMNQAFLSDTEIELIKNKIRTETLLKEQLNQKLAELENQKNYNIRNGLAELTQSFLIEGNSLRDIWNNLWQDLAREAIQRLFQVKATASLLGSLFGLFGSGTPEATNTGLPVNYADGTSWGDITKDWVQFDWTKTHTGASIGTYPKMHTGGVVANGRIGVVPKLQNDEVIRTLQVGEEVNSLEDRRTNEMLTAIVLKALDGQNNRPNNFNIMALDSKSFAEYLNDNADILTAVLAKQGAMGRR